MLFATAAGAGAGATGVLVLAAFLLGLFTSNSAITLGSAFGYMSATRNFSVYAGVAIVTALFSLVVGSIFLFGGATALPTLFGG